MKIRFAVDQAEALRRGIDAPKPTILLEVDPSKLSPYARDVIADNLVKGHDLTHCSKFHLIRASDEEFGECVAAVDSEFEGFRKTISDDVSKLAKDAAVGPESGKIMFAVARQGDRKLAKNEKPEVTSVPWGIRGRCAFWPYFDCTPDFDLAAPNGLKRNFAKELILEALKEPQTAEYVTAIHDQTVQARNTAYRVAHTILKSSDVARTSFLKAGKDVSFGLSDYMEDRLSSWELDQAIAQSHLPSGWKPWPRKTDWVTPLESAKEASKQSFGQVLERLPKDSQAWISEDTFYLDALLGKDDSYALAAWMVDDVSCFAMSGPREWSEY